MRSCRTELLEIAPNRSSACIHGAIGLPAPAVMAAEAAIALLDDEEAVLETVDAEGASLQTVDAEEAAPARSSEAEDARAQDVEAGR